MYKREPRIKDLRGIVLDIACMYLLQDPISKERHPNILEVDLDSAFFWADSLEGDDYWDSIDQEQIPVNDKNPPIGSGEYVNLNRNNYYIIDIFSTLQSLTIRQLWKYKKK